MQKGLEVNFYDLFRHIMKKWAVLLAFVLVFGVAADCYGYHRASVSAARERQALEEYARSVGTSEEMLPEYMTAELAELRSALTEEEASFAESAARLYMYRVWASEKINAELVVGEPDQGDLEIVQTLYYANEGVQSATQIMTSAEKAYYNVLIKELSGTEVSVPDMSAHAVGVLQPKWLVIGCVLGALLGAFVISMRYLLSGKLRSASDLEVPYGVPVLAELQTAEDPELDAAAKGLGRLLKDKKQVTVAVCAADTPEAGRVSRTLSELLSSQGLSVTEISAEEKGFVGQIADKDTVLFIEQVGRSRYQTIEKHLSSCRKFDIPTAGCIVLR